MVETVEYHYHYISSQPDGRTPAPAMRILLVVVAQSGILQRRISWWHIGQGEPPARAPRGLSIVAIQLHVDREAPATTECVLRTRVEGQDLAQGSVPLAGFLI